MLLRSYDSTGFAPYLDELLAVDYLRGRGVKVLGDAHSVSGTAAGIAADGGLLVDTVEGVRKILSGEVSVRAMT
jgi:BirA family biotin operon repressor/biotin-[acetyl-CoA-carboxylase] ligase